MYVLPNFETETEDTPLHDQTKTPIFTFYQDPFQSVQIMNPYVSSSKSTRVAASERTRAALLKRHQTPPTVELRGSNFCSSVDQYLLELCLHKARNSALELGRWSIASRAIHSVCHSQCHKNPDLNRSAIRQCGKIQSARSNKGA